MHHRSRSQPRFVAALLCLGLVAGISACRHGGPAGSVLEGARAAMGYLPRPRPVFARSYVPTDDSVEANAPSYRLPLELSGTCNLGKVPHALRTPTVDDVLRRNGFVVADCGQEDDLLAVYEQAKSADLPMFVTVDTVLHLYHLQFDETLRGIEEREFVPAIAQLTRGMLEQSLRTLESAPADAASGELKEAARRNAAFFAVALTCLEPQAVPPPLVAEIVRAEMALIEAHRGREKSPLFAYHEDYSQYVPRGHYTRSEALQRYFRAMMWYGRMSMMLRGVSDGGLVTDEDARVQTMQACLIASTLHGKQGDALLQTWERIYKVTAFCVGFADDLTPADYDAALRKVGAVPGDRATAFAPEKVARLRDELTAAAAARRFGGGGQAQGTPQFIGESDDETLVATQGMRLMGQRFVPSSYIMWELLDSRAGDFTGRGRPFTCLGDRRAFARGLDVMAVLGSQRAYEILREEGDTAYTRYDGQLASLKDEFGGLSQTDWNCNLYYGWLYCLRTLLSDFGRGYPTFMSAEPYKDRLLGAALASWAELAHDTVLYAGPPPPMMSHAMPPPVAVPPPPGYVEPVPEFYGRMLALTRMTREGLGATKVLSDTETQRLAAFEGLTRRLLLISKVELRGEAISQEDADYIKGIAARVEACLKGISEEDAKTALVADVHTDGSRCLQQATGHVKTMLAAYKLPDGRIAMGMGPVLSYYEFQHPISDRLTDEKWREEVLAKRPPAAPQWVGSFYPAQ